LISSSLKPDDALITIFCSLPVALSLADTFKIPFASIGKAVKGRQRGILVLADHVEAAIKKARGAE